MIPVKSFFRGPYGVMAIVLVMYLVKVTTKLWAGYYTGSQMITGDGWHNVADIFEAMIVIGTIVVANRPTDGSYPFGRKNLESLFSLAVGLFLFAMAVMVAAKSIVGLTLAASVLLPWKTVALQYIGQVETPEYSWWIAGIILFSAVMSMFVSRMQIATGKRCGHDSMVADGEETASDGRLELAVFAGIVGQLLVGWAWIEYPFALVVAYLMTCTAWEIFWNGLDSLLQKSIGQEHEDEIAKITNEVHGVIRLSDRALDGSDGLKTFRVGSTVIIILKFISDEHPETIRLMKKALVVRLVKYLGEQEFTDAKYFVRVSPSPKDPKRVAYVICRNPHTNGDIVAPSIIDATHLRICDYERGVCYRWKDISIEYKSPLEVFALLRQKHVTTLYEFSDDTRLTFTTLGGEVLKGNLESSEMDRVKIENALSFDPELLGID